MKSGLLFSAIGLVLIASLMWFRLTKPNAIPIVQKEDSMPDYYATVNAPEFPEGLQWLNTDRPLRLRDLRGKIVLLDFWTYCCINCMHIIPDLKKLEKKYEKELVVIGVHSAKFTTEQQTDNIRQAILRYEIEHPVVNDREMTVWQQYGVRAWPTLVLIDPDGKVVGAHSGEGIYEPFDRTIAKLIETFEKKGTLDRRPLNLKLERERMPASLLSFPGKVLADEKSDQLFIADSNHNRIVVVSLKDNAVKEIIGTGETGMKDGKFEEATFNHPQGMAFDGKQLYVADTENHAIRLVDFEKRTVTTLAGTGQQAGFGQARGPARETALNSPWDLVLHNGWLYIAMAGSHQIWRLHLKTHEVEPYAGSGREARIDGPLAASALAQPSGITTDGKKLYFADSECSSIRSADLNPNGNVETIVGGDLFDFGDKDGRGLQARLQHPLGVAYHEGIVYVADTYNNKIKRIVLREGRIETLFGTGEEGLRDGEKATFDEPGGVSIAKGKLYIADTNNHVIRVADLNTKQVETLQIKRMEKLKPQVSAMFRGENVQLPAQSVEPGAATLNLTLQLPKGFKLNPQAPSAVKVSTSNGGILSLGEGKEQIFTNPQFPVSLPVQVKAGEASLQVDYVLYYCRAEAEGLCYFKEVRFNLPVKGQAGAGNSALSIACRVEQ